MKPLVVILALALAGCATTSEPKIITKVVEVPVATPCAVTVPPAPAYPDTDEAIRAAPNIFEKTKLIVAGRLMRIAHERELRAALIGCTG